MVFSSPIFLFGFLPIVLLLSLLVGRSAQNRILLAASLLFYAWGEPVFVFLLLLSIGVNFVVARAFSRGGARRASLLAIGVGFNLLLLVSFKYGAFLLENTFELFGGSVEGASSMIERWPELPIGISFYTFQAISYLVDVYRGQCRPQRSFLDLGLYISMFPQLIAGPIVRYSEIEDQLANRKRSLEGFNAGASRFVRGLAKKVLIADTLAVVADASFGGAPGGLSVSMAWLGLICYGFQLYYDFSGYSDMAIGMGKMFGFRFPENFNFPYTARSVREFWRRWHMTLSRWFRDYLYIPLGGNRNSSGRVGFNLLIVFALCGLWHGASWGFLVWGLYYGCFLLLERTVWGRFVSSLPKLVQHGYLLGIVFFGWVFFRSETLADAGGYFRSLIGAGNEALTKGAVSVPLEYEAILALVVAISFSTKYPTQLGEALSRSSLGRGRSYVGYVGTLVLLVICMSAVASSAYSPFLYFRF